MERNLKENIFPKSLEPKQNLQGLSLEIKAQFDEQWNNIQKEEKIKKFQIIIEAKKAEITARDKQLTETWDILQEYCSTVIQEQKLEIDKTKIKEKLTQWYEQTYDSSAVKKKKI